MYIIKIYNYVNIYPAEINIVESPILRGYHTANPALLRDMAILSIDTVSDNVI